MTRVVAVVQARMSSQRLPGKVLRPLPAGGELTVLDWVVRRLRRATSVDTVVVATSEEPSDDPLEAHCVEAGYPVFRGSLDDVLARVHDAARLHRADVVVRVTADCPLVDPEIVDLVVAAHLEGPQQFTANRLPPPADRTFPVGLDVEVADMDALETAANEAVSRAHREHVMPFLYENEDRFGVRVLDTPEDAGQVRWTVDTAEDLEAVSLLIVDSGAEVGSSWLELLAHWRAHPDLSRVNRGIQQRTATEHDSRPTQPPRRPA